VACERRYHTKINPPLPHFTCSELSAAKCNLLTVEKGSYEESTLTVEENKDILGLRLDILIYENSALLGRYAALSANSLPTFQEYLSVPSSKVKKSKLLYYFRRGQIPKDKVLEYSIFS
jgi:hypothetical protein